jgi:hypothetical protein
MMLNLNEKLKDSFIVRPFTDNQRLIREINNWSNNIPNSPIKDLGNQIKITESTVKEFYFVKLESFAEIRELENKIIPYSGNQIENQNIFNKNEIDIWDEKVSIPKLFTNSNFDIQIKGSKYICDCETCNATGDIACYNCGGQGKNKCSKCHGAGQKKCSICDGRGEKRCHFCNGRGQIEKSKYNPNGSPIKYFEGCNSCSNGYIPCSSCQQGIQRCTSCAGNGQETCSKCSGRGKNTCGKCVGKRQLLKYINLNIQFISGKYPKILNESKLPENFIRDINLDETYLQSPFVEIELDKFDKKFSESIDNNIFGKTFNELLEKSNEELNDFSDTKIHKQKYSIYKHDNLIETFFSYKGKMYSIYFYNDFKNSFSNENPILEHSDNIGEIAKKYFDEQNFTLAYSEINSALKIFPNNEKYQILKKEIVESANKRYTVALILAFFQLDRFYTGRYLLGILKIITIGGFMIMYIMDIVFLLTGKYKDSNGNIIKKLE